MTVAFRPPEVRRAPALLLPQTPLVGRGGELPERVADNPGAVFLDLDMLVEVGGRQRSVPEYQALLARHGFDLDHFVDRALASSVLVARPVT